MVSFRCAFYYATSFNQDLSEWNVSSATDMGSMFSSASSFNQDISRWNVTQVRHMDFMFNGAKSFNQNLSGWNICSAVNLSEMFQDAVLEQDLKRMLNVSSFFERDYRFMEANERAQVFLSCYNWDRRKSFLLFLVTRRYINSTAITTTTSTDVSNNACFPCDCLFDVEDIDRYICIFL